MNLFINDIFDNIMPPSNTIFRMDGLKIPKNKDIYFMAKWHELFEKYQTARLFIEQTQKERFDDWIISPEDNKNAEKYFTLYIKSILYEAALINYNILVDLSWTLTYVSAEYSLYEFDLTGNVINVKDVSGLHTIEDAYQMLRDTEKAVTTPHTQGSPFTYLKKMCPEYTDAIDLIINFWRLFSNSQIRSLYNYTKHKGVLHYKELDSLSHKKVWKFYDYNNKTMPSDISDVQKQISLNESITDLISFDDNILFPYINELIKLLKEAVNPSPIIM